MSYPFLEAMGLTAPEGVDVAYEELLAEVLTSGARKSDRTGTGTLSVFGRQLRYDLTKGFPRITTKFVAMRRLRVSCCGFCVAILMCVGCKSAASLFGMSG